MTTMLLGGLWHGAGWTFVIWGGLHGVYLVINHGWRRLTGADGGASGWRKVLGIGLTFVAVIIAWVPFRSPDLDATLRMWAGMFALNGISVPSGLESVMPKTFPTVIEFGGLNMGLTGIALWIPLGLSIIWMLPNTQEWMAVYAPAWDVVSHRAKFAWRPTKYSAALLGVVLVWSLMNFGRASEFLYFQF